MSMLLTQFIEKEQQLKKLQEQLDKLKQDPTFKLEMEFKERLLGLMTEFGKTEKEVIRLLDPSPSVAVLPTQGKPRKKRKLKIYRNPETGEVIETRGGNHGTLKHWKQKYGAEKVDAWLVEGI